MTASKKLNVLVVEDVKFTAALISSYITSLGHSCKIISSGLKAIDFLEAQDEFDELEGFDGHVDIVITDYQLGDSTGLEIFHWFKRFVADNGGDFSNFPAFVMVTASHEPEILAEIESSGFLATLTKPVNKLNIKQLLDSVSEGNVYLTKNDNKSKILIADASKRLQSVVFDLFAAQGFTILAAQTEEETLTYLRDFDNIKMVICSLEIVDCTSIELLKSIESEKLSSTPPVILVTDSNDMDTIQLASMSGFTKVIQSPIEAAFLKQKFNQAFSSGNVIDKSKTKQSILLVDDINFHNVVIKNTLEKSKYIADNYELRLAHNACEALEILKTDSSIKLAIVDYVLPDFNGLDLYSEFFKYVKSQKKYSGLQPDFALISAVKEERLEKVALNLGFKSVFAKPFDKPELISVVENILKGKPLNDEGNNEPLGIASLAAKSQNIVNNE